MLKQLLTFELKYHTRQVTFIIAAVLFTALGALLAQGNYGSSELHRNAPYVIAYITSILSLLSIFVSTLFCASVVLRDTTYNFNAFLYSTPLPSILFFSTRLAGLLLAVFLVLALGVAGIFWGTVDAAADELGPYRLQYYLQPLLVFGGPNILFCSSVIFGVALLTRQTRAVYITGAMLFMLYFIGSILGNSPLMANSALKTHEYGLLPHLLDPFGITSFFATTRSWPVAARNVRLFRLEGPFLANRLFWTALAVLTLFLCYRFFRFRLPAPYAKKDRKAAPLPVDFKSYHTVEGKPAGYAYTIETFVSQLNLETASLFKHVPFLVMLVLWAFLFAVDLKETILHGPYNIRFYAATGYIVDYLQSAKPALLLLVFYSSEIIHRERSANIQSLVFSTPVPASVMWGAKCATLSILIGVLVSVNIAIGIGFQWVNGFTHVDWRLYLSLYYYCGWPLMLFALLIVCIQTITGNKYLGILLSLVVITVFLFGRRLGLESLLTRYAAIPSLEYTYMNGFGHAASATNWYLLYWTGCAGVLSLLGAGLWQGSHHASLFQRLRTIGQRWKPAGKVSLTVFILIWMGSGIYIQQQTPAVSTARSNQHRLNWQAKYEQTYRLRDTLPQPYITAVRLQVHLFPAERRYSVQGDYLLKNGASTPISILWLGIDPEVDKVHYSVPNAVVINSDPLFKQDFFRFNKPLMPGDTTSLHFRMDVNQSTFAAFNAEHSIQNNGSYIELEKYLPSPGYNGRYEIDGLQTRKRYGLPQRLERAVTDSNYRLVAFETVVSTDAGQQVVTVGSLQKSWEEQGRRYYHYKSSQPIAFMFALSSARYAVHQSTWKGTSLNLYYQPGQAHNLPVLEQAMKDALDYGTTHWSPYPFRQFTLAEIPQYPGAATAYPGVVYSTERINFMSDLNDSTRFNNTYAITAHEVAHQWWANALAPLDAPGRGMLTESLAKYSEYLATEHRFGKPYLRRLLQADNNLYFALRNLGSELELPPSRSHQSYVYYQKGGLALYAIKELIGEERMNRALRNLIAHHGTRQKKATSDDLLYELKAGASPQETMQIESLLETVSEYNNKLIVKQCEQLRNGRYKVTLEVKLAKRTQVQGSLQDQGINDQITIGLFSDPVTKWNSRTKALYLQSHHFENKLNLLTIEVDQKPLAAIIDPWASLPDADLSDNQCTIP